MDDRMLQESTKKLRALDKALSDLAVRQRQTESKLAGEHEAIRKCVAQRAAVVGGLIDADEEQSKKLHRQLDSLDAQIKGSERQAEALQHLLRSIATETADTTASRDRLNQLVGQEQNQRAFQAWTVDMEAKFKAATLALAEARESLGRLTVAAAHGTERFSGAASTWSATRFDEFERLQANPDSLLGFRQALPWYRNVIVHILPMVRG